MNTKKTALENYTLLLKELETMKETKFNITSFIRKIQPFCKTDRIGKKFCFIRVRGSMSGVSIQIMEDCFIVRPNRSVHEFLFYCESSKLLLQKLIKHNLLTV